MEYISSIFSQNEEGRNSELKNADKFNINCGSMITLYKSRIRGAKFMSLLSESLLESCLVSNLLFVYHNEFSGEKTI